MLDLLFIICGLVTSIVVYVMSQKQQAARLDELAGILGLQPDPDQELARATVQDVPIELIVGEGTFELRSAIPSGGVAVLTHGAPGIAPLALAPLAFACETTREPMSDLRRYNGRIDDAHVVVPVPQSSDAMDATARLDTLVRTAAALATPLPDPAAALAELARTNRVLFTHLAVRWPEHPATKELAATHILSVPIQHRLAVAQALRDPDLMRAVATAPASSTKDACAAFNMLATRGDIDDATIDQVLDTDDLDRQRHVLTYIMDKGDVAQLHRVWPPLIADEHPLRAVALKLACGPRGHRILGALRTAWREDCDGKLLHALATHGSAEDEARIVTSLKRLSNTLSDDSLEHIAGTLRRMGTWASVPALEALAEHRSGAVRHAAERARSAIITRSGPQPAGGLSIASGAGGISTADRSGQLSSSRKDPAG